MKGTLILEVSQGVETSYEVEIVEPLASGRYTPCNMNAVTHMLDCSLALRLPIPLGVQVTSEKHRAGVA